MNRCEECHVIPEDLLQMLVDRMVALESNKKEARRQINTFLESRRTAHCSGSHGHGNSVLVR